MNVSKSSRRLLPLLNSFGPRIKFKPRSLFDNYSQNGGLMKSGFSSSRQTHTNTLKKIPNFRGANHNYSRIALGSVIVGSVGFVLMYRNSISKNERQKESKYPPQLTKKYIIGKVLGEGAYGTVYLATHKKTRKLYACKIIPRHRGPFSDALLRNEVDIMEACGEHENIVSLVEKISTPNELILIMDLVVGGELFDRIVEKGRITEREASFLLKKVCQAIQHLHSQGICHNDIKPENLLLTSKGDNAELKITDFGTSLFMGEKMFFDKPSGTAAYHAPEIILHQPCSKALDIWALGIVIYITLCGVHPFDPKGNATNAKIVFRACQGKIPENDVWDQLSDSSKDLIKHLLDPNPDTRYTADQALNHPWFGGQASNTELPQKQIENLKGFQNLNLVRAGVMAVAACIPTNVQHAKKFYMEDPACVSVEERKGNKYWKKVGSEVYIRAFRLFDKKNTGVISKTELNKLFISFGQHLTEKELEMIVAEADLNGDGEISVDEFIGMMQRRMNNAEDKKDGTYLLKIFEIFDVDGNGFIDEEELQNVLNAVGQKVTKEQVAEIMLAADTNGNGMIDYNEFTAFLMHFDDEVKNNVQTEV